MRVLQNSLISRLKIMAHLDIAERRMPQDGRINLELDGEPIDVRVATIPSVNGESVALRLLTRKKFDMGAIGLDPDTEAKFRKLLAAPNGIILITGPTGSGKSTTLYTLLKELNTKDRRIVTIEDPVENKLDGIIQIAVNRHPWRAHRSLGFLHTSHERCRRRHLPSARHGHRALHGLVLRARLPGTATRPHPVSALQSACTS
jgi:type II secretory ATPase GspE/PulE/Tfp pilus assembly ATPase PilB-like protein